MFTGIIETCGTIAAIDTTDGDWRLTVDVGDLALDAVGVGDSIAVSGVCLTVVDKRGNTFIADVSRETLSLTTLSRLAVGSRVNLERALRAGDPLGGHLVSGHVDALGTLTDKTGDARSWRLVFAADPSLARYWAPKGSVCVDGISLTVNDVYDDGFGVNIVPHTMAATTLADRVIGDPVNLEIDVIARYVARLVPGT